MPRAHHVLIVAQSPAIATALRSWLGSVHCELTIVTTYAAAKNLLDTGPSLLISELKLGEYNGLHLALKARASGIPAIVIGPEDAVLRKDASELGAVYLTSVIRRPRLLEIVKERLDPTPGLKPERDQVWHVGRAPGTQAPGRSNRLLH